MIKERRVARLRIDEDFLSCLDYGPWNEDRVARLAQAVTKPTWDGCVALDVMHNTDTLEFEVVLHHPSFDVVDFGYSMPDIEAIYTVDSERKIDGDSFRCSIW